MAEPADDFLAELARWAAEQRVTEAVAQRSLARSLLQQLADTATWEGILVDLAEERSPVEVTAGTNRLSGTLVGVGQDFFVLYAGGAPVLVRNGAVTSLSPISGPLPGNRGPAGRRPRRRSAPSGDRHPPLALGFIHALEAVVAETSPMRVLTAGPPVDGHAVALGQDVLTLRREKGPRTLVHIPLAAVAACELR